MNNYEIRESTLIILPNRRKVPETILKTAASVRHCDIEQIAGVMKTVDLIINDVFDKAKRFYNNFNLSCHFSWTYSRTRL
jgi:hypothetical protein